MSSRDEYIRKIQAKLEVWNTEIDRLTAKAGGYPGDRLRNFSMPGKTPGKTYIQGSS